MIVQSLSMWHKLESFESGGVVFECKEGLNVNIIYNVFGGIFKMFRYDIT